MDFQAESLPTVFTGCTLLGGAGLLLALLNALRSPLSVAAGAVADLAGRTSPGIKSPGTSWLCLYSLVSFGLFFGLGGLLSSWLALLPPLQVIAALVSGLAVGGVTAWACYLAGQPRPGEAASGSLVGRTGRVTLSPQGATPGRVLLGTDRQPPLPAQSRDLLVPGDRVLIVADAGGLLDVLRWEGNGHP